MNGLGGVFFWKKGKYALTYFAAIAAALLLFGLPVRAEGGALVSGLEPGDLVHFYAMGSEEDGKLAWVQPLEDWLTDHSGEEVYANFLTGGPSALRRLSSENVEIFLQTIIPEMKTEEGGFQLTEYPQGGITAEEETVSCAESDDFPPGCYLVLIEGTKRVYSPVLLFLQEGSEASVTVTEEGYSSPEFDLELSGEDGSALSGAEAGDLIKAVADVTFPAYPAVYSADKRIQAICLISGAALPYEEGSLSVSDSSGKLEQGREYQLEAADGVSVFWPADEAAQEEEALFYLSEGWYYLMDGQAAGNDFAQVLATYNEIHGTEWEAVQEETGCSVRIIVPAGEESEGGISLQVTAGYRLGSAYDSERSVELEGQCLYSVSPVNVDRIAVQVKSAKIPNRRIRLTLTAGGLIGGESDEAPMALSGGTFEVFRLGTKLPGSATAQQIQDYVAEAGSARYKTLYLTDGAGSSAVEVYLSAGSFTTDGEGCGGIAGLSDTGYLVMQTVYPEGYGMSRTAYRIESWEETDLIKEIDWTDYTGVFLPETGGRGTTIFIIVGIILMIAAIVLILVTVKRRNSRWEDEGEYGEDEYEEADGEDEYGEDEYGEADGEDEYGEDEYEEADGEEEYGEADGEDDDGADKA